MHNKELRYSDKFYYFKYRIKVCSVQKRLQEKEAHALERLHLLMLEKIVYDI